MYGLLLQNLAEYVITSHGQSKWDEIRTSLKIKDNEFGAKDVFPEGQLIKMGKKSILMLGLKDEEFYEGMGVYFVELTNKLGYHDILTKLGRHLRDFLLNLDNFHDYLRFKFPRMKAPSFFVEKETNDSILLQYRSKRRGFHYYVQGQIKEIGRRLFKQNVEISLQKQEIVFDTVICTYLLNFDNKPYDLFTQAVESKKESSLPIKASVIFEMFPFCILFQKDLKVTSLGVALQQVMPGLVGKRITAYFELVKPLIEFKFDLIVSRSNNMFELATSEEIDKLGASKTSNEEGRFSEEINLEDDIDKTLHIKGQMLYIDEWNQLLFLCCPMMNSLVNLIWTGLFVNDLSMHDYSRDIMLATSQEQIELKMALNAAEVKANTLNKQIKQLDEIQSKTDELLYQMIPKAVASRLRKGEDPLSTCEVFPSVTMLFSDIVGFTTICSNLKPVEVVIFLNNLYTLFDFLVDQNAVYKVETIGDAYLIVAGCPIKTTTHSLKICDMAFDMMDGIGVMSVPNSDKVVEMRIGCHTGSVVAGIVGLKMPRYCLFGLNVALTEKLESNSKPMKIHISDSCQATLPSQYKTEERTGDEELTQKIGGMRSYFLNSKEGRRPLEQSTLKALLPTDSEAPRIEDDEQQRSSSALKENTNGEVAPENGDNTINNSTHELTPNGKSNSNEPLQIDESEDNGSLYDPSAQERRVSSVQAQYCGGFNNDSSICNIL